jgi:hypothetical protein
VERSFLSCHTVVVSPPPRALETLSDTSSPGKKLARIQHRDMRLTIYGSRSPRGVLLALRNAARFYQDGKIVDVAGPGKMPLWPHFRESIH